MATVRGQEHRDILPWYHLKGKRKIPDFFRESGLFVLELNMPSEKYES
jgi:hypothetical protein